MSAALFFLTLLIGATPAFLIFDGPIVHGFITATSAVAMAIVALSIRPGEADFLRTLVRPLVVFATVPALWMLFQILPLKITGLAHPIWESASTALGRPIGGSISIDPGATLMSLGRYLSTIVIVFIASAVAIDRQRAGWILFLVTAMTTAIAVMAILALRSDYSFLGNIKIAIASGVVTNCVALGVILLATAVIRTFEWFKTQHLDQNGGGIRFLLTLAAYLVGIMVCSFALVMVTTASTIVVVAFGIATLTAVLMIRGLGLGPWGCSAIAATALVAAIAIVTLHPANPALDLTLAYATHVPTPLIAVTQRILADVHWTGTGAGTFANLLPIYRDIDEATIATAAPTATAAIVIEMGRPMLWAIVIIVIALVLKLLRGALERGRDAFYPAAGAGCLVALTLEGFGNAGLFSSVVSIIAAATLGMAIAQSKSRSIQ